MSEERNPSPPPEENGEGENEILQGDRIGDTAFSQLFALKTLTAILNVKVRFCYHFCCFGVVRCRHLN